MQQPQPMIPMMPSFPPSNITTEQIQKYTVAAERFHAVAKLLIDEKISPERVLIFQSRNFRGKYICLEAGDVTEKKRDGRGRWRFSNFTFLGYFPSGSVVDGLAAALLGRCQMKGSVTSLIRSLMLKDVLPAQNIVLILLYLDDNKKLILAIMDNQNLGKLADCAHYQALLQKNLMYLAAIADAQPQGPMMPPQMAPHPVMQQGGFYMQHPQVAAVAQQPIFTPKVPLQFNNPHPMQDLQQQIHQHHQHGLPGQMGTRPAGVNNSMNPVYSEASLGGGSNGGPPATKAPSDVRGGNKQDAPEAGASAADGPGSSATGQGGRDGEAK